MVQGYFTLVREPCNHPTLWAQVNRWMEAAESQELEGIEHSYDSRVEAGHGRREHRQVWAVPLAVMGTLHESGQWAGLQTVVRVKRVRHLWNKTTQEMMFYLSVLPCDAVLIGKAIRVVMCKS